MFARKHLYKSNTTLLPPQKRYGRNTKDIWGISFMAPKEVHNFDSIVLTS